ncbi:Inosose isomerase [Thalassoglobus neptunius]|uniref:Inosose isomerase n=2 Tax=Thalassoglobus neptunius TaxID=1938619 RepID=A0A5C5X4C1_9PLAN|nr:Inosose isomerase [Thalassoglobus neptunius]
MKMTRRTCLTGLSGIAAAGLVSSPGTVHSHETTSEKKIRFCLNTSTIRGQKLPLEEEVDLVSETGYDGIEPWIREIETYQQSGKSLSDLKKKIADKGLQVESAIGFARWIVDDAGEREKGLEQMKRDMELVSSIGGTRIAAPPVGMHGQDSAALDLFAAAERYAVLLELGREMGVTPQVEIWGPSRNLSRLGEAVFVAVESGDQDACVLPDVYHIFRGGSDFEGLSLLNGSAIHCFHFNDYPATPDREKLGDGDRVYPGDGVAPWQQLVDILDHIGFAGAVSLELFNKSYWAEDPRQVLQTGLSKMKAVFQSHSHSESAS